MPNYSMWLIEYAHCPTQPVSSLLAGQHNQGETMLAFTYLVLRGAGHVAMVDVGYNYAGNGKEKADRFGVTDWQPPEKLLAKIGLRPVDVDTVILTHAHFDHMGNLPAFRNAQVYLQRRELSEWIGVLGKGLRYRFLTQAIDPEDIVAAVRAGAEGRLTLSEGDVDNVLPGVHLRPVYDSHTYGSQLVVIDNSDGPGAGRWVVSGDNCYLYDNVLGIGGDGVYVPVGFGVGSAHNMVVALDRMMELAGGRLDRLIIGHDANSWQHFPSWQTPDGLYVAELNLAPGDTSCMP
jgi:N-acyl homoserine lactone hydrolase